MAALIVVGSIILLLAVILFSPVWVRFAYQNGAVRAKAGYLVVAVDFSPDKLAKRAARKAERATKKEYRKQKAEEGTEEKKKKAAKDTLLTVWSLIKASGRGFRILKRRLILYGIRASVLVGGENAHETAMNYAKLCAISAGGLAAADTVFTVREPEISITPDFTRESTSWDIAVKARISPVYILAAGLCVLRAYFKTLKRNKIKREKIKGGSKHEPTTHDQ